MSACKIQALLRGVLARRPRTIDNRPLKRRPAPTRNATSPTAIHTAGSTGSLRAHAPSPPPPPANSAAAHAGRPSSLAPLSNQASTPELHRPSSSHSQRTQPLTLASGSRSSSAQSLSLRPVQRAPSPTTAAAATAATETTPTGLNSTPLPNRALSPSNMLEPLSPDGSDLDLDRAAESVSSVLPPCGTFQSLCLIAAESRLTSQRRAGGRAYLAPATMGVAHLLDERRALKRELQLAKERHLPAAAAAAGGARPAAQTAKAKLAHTRSRSLSSAPSKSNQCEGCPPDADWKVIFQPLLLLYKQINAALKAKGVTPYEGPPATAQPSRTGSSSNGTLALGATPASPLLTSLPHGPGSGSGSAPPPINAGVTAPNHRLHPLTVTTSTNGSTSSSVTVPRRALRKSVGSGLAAIGLAGSGGLATTAASANMTITGNVRANARASTPGSSALSTPATGFAQWSQQSTATVQAAQLPAGKANAANANANTNPFHPYLASTTSNAAGGSASSADWQRLKMGKSKSVGPIITRKQVTGS